LKIQKYIKGKEIRDKLQKLRKSVFKIQGWIRSIWLRRIFLETVHAAYKIKKTLISHYRNSHEKIDLWKKYTEEQQVLMGGIRFMENTRIFGQNIPEITKIDNFEKLRKLQPKLYKAITEIPKNNILEHLAEPNPYANSKITAFSVILDIHILAFFHTKSIKIGRKYRKL